MDDLTHLLRSRIPGKSLPQEFYVDPELFEEELSRVFHANWLFAGALQISRMCARRTASWRGRLARAPLRTTPGLRRTLEEGSCPVFDSSRGGSDRP